MQPTGAIVIGRPSPDIAHKTRVRENTWDCQDAHGATAPKRVLEALRVGAERSSETP